MTRARVQVHYAGRVQGVGFRYTVKSLVTGFEVVGTVRNLADGRVELIVEGAKPELEAFLQAVRESGVGGLIADESAAWSNPRGEFCGFEIIG
ncbi:MAG: acylphosphatase [Verrucomicrobia bacterium]|nr:acylphosphatase [Verrucomicrobiota bacterium]